MRQMHNDKPKEPTNMLGRLGNVLYWAGCIGAFGGMLYGLERAARYGVTDGGEKVWYVLISALPIWLLGWAARYVLTGSKK